MIYSRYLTILIFTFFITSSTFAQLSISGVLGGTLSNLKIYDEFNEKYYSNEIRAGLHFGLGLQTELPDLIFAIDESINAKILIEQKGKTSPIIDEESGLEIDSSLYTLTYANFPVVAKASYDQGDFIIYGEFGFYISQLLKARRKSKGVDELMDEFEALDIDKSHTYSIGYNDVSDTYKPFDTGLVFGVGLEFSQVYIETNYEHGIFNIYPEADEHVTWKRSLKLPLGYKMNY